MELCLSECVRSTPIYSYRQCLLLYSVGNFLSIENTSSLSILVLHAMLNTVVSSRFSETLKLKIFNKKFISTSKVDNMSTVGAFLKGKTAGTEEVCSAICTFLSALLF